MRSLGVFIITMLLNMVPIVVYAQEMARRTAYGKVVNGTGGGGSVEGIEVTSLPMLMTSYLK